MFIIKGFKSWGVGLFIVICMIILRIGLFSSIFLIGLKMISIISLSKMGFLNVFLLSNIVNFWWFSVVSNFFSVNLKIG